MDLRGEVASPSEFVLLGNQDEDFSTTAVNSDGRWIATSLADDTVQLWDLEANDSKTFSRVQQPFAGTRACLRRESSVPRTVGQKVNRHRLHKLCVLCVWINLAELQ